MALSFNCTLCGEKIVVKFLSRGDEAICRACRRPTVVSRNALETEEEPSYRRVVGPSAEGPDENPLNPRSIYHPLHIKLQCPQCNRDIEPNAEHCPLCDFDFAGTVLLNPAHFVWQAVLLSPFVAIFLAARNWGRVGKIRLRNWWLTGAVLAALFLMMTVYIATEEGLTRLNRIVSLFGFFLGMHLWQQQRVLHRACARARGRSASVFKGTLAGIGFTALLACAAIGFSELTVVPFYYGDDYYAYLSGEDYGDLDSSGWVIMAQLRYENGRSAAEASVMVTMTDDSLDVVHYSSPDVDACGCFIGYCRGDTEYSLFAEDEDGRVAWRSFYLPGLADGICDTMTTTLFLAAGSCIQGSIRLGESQDHCGTFVQIDEFSCWSETDCSGFFELAAVPVGTWTLRVMAEGYEDDVRTVTVTSAGDTVRALPTTLVPTADRRV